MNVEEISKKICLIAEKENTELSKISNEGIFHMPELAFAYLCGKEIMRDKEIYFGDSEVKWIREFDFGNGGPTDLIFEINGNEKIAIEFKLRDTTQAYETILWTLLCRDSTIVAELLIYAHDFSIIHGQS